MNGYSEPYISDPIMSNQTNEICEDTELSLQQSELLKSFTWWVQVGGNLPVGIVGFVLNSIALLVLSTPSMRGNFFNLLLIVLAIFDNLYLSCEISEVFRHRVRTPAYEHQYIFANIIYPVRSIFMYSSILMTMALAHERYQAMKNPANYRKRSESPNINKRLFYYLVPVLIFSTVYYLPKCFDLDVDEIIKCSGGNEIINNHTHIITTPIDEGLTNDSAPYINCTKTYTLIPTKLRINHYYVLWYINISNLLLTAIIPFSFLLYTNCRIYLALKDFMQRQPSIRRASSQLRRKRDCEKEDREMRTRARRASLWLGGIVLTQRTRANESKKTIILFSIVIIFIVCHSLRIVLNIEEFLNLAKLIKISDKACENSSTFWVEIATPINQLLLIINSSCNFFIYSFFDSAFQKSLNQSIIFRRSNRIPALELDNAQNRNCNTINNDTRTSPNVNIELSERNYNNNR